MKKKNYQYKEEIFLTFEDQISPAHEEPTYTKAINQTLWTIKESMLLTSEETISIALKKQTSSIYNKQFFFKP